MQDRNISLYQPFPRSCVAGRGSRRALARLLLRDARHGTVGAATRVLPLLHDVYGGEGRGEEERFGKHPTSKPPRAHFFRIRASDFGFLVFVCWILSQFRKKSL